MFSLALATLSGFFSTPTTRTLNLLAIVMALSPKLAANSNTVSPGWKLAQVNSCSVAC